MRLRASRTDLWRIPVSTSDRDSLAEQLWHLAKLEDRIDCRADAIDHLARAAAVLDELLDATPSSPMGQQRLGECLYWLATLEDRVDHEATAVVHFHRAAELFEILLRIQPQDAKLRCNLSTCYHVIGRLRADAGHPGESLEPYRKAIALRESLSRDEPRSLAGTVIAPARGAGSAKLCRAWVRLTQRLKPLRGAACTSQANRAELQWGMPSKPTRPDEFSGWRPALSGTGCCRASRAHSPPSRAD